MTNDEVIKECDRLIASNETMTTLAAKQIEEMRRCSAYFKSLVEEAHLIVKAWQRLSDELKQDDDTEDWKQ